MNTENQSRAEAQEQFLRELLPLLKKNYFNNAYYMMWNEKECVGDVIRRLLGMEPEILSEDDQEHCEQD